MIECAPVSIRSRLSFGGPRSQQPSHQHQLADVLRRVVRDQQELSEERLAVASRNFGEQVALRIVNHLLHRLSIASIRSNARIPGLRIRRLRGRRPVVRRPIPFDVFRVAAEIENVLLHDADVLEQLPRGIRETSRHVAPEVGRKVCHRCIEVGMGIVPTLQADQMVPKWIHTAHRPPPLVERGNTARKARLNNDERIRGDLRKRSMIAPPGQSRDRFCGLRRIGRVTQRANPSSTACRSVEATTACDVSITTGSPTASGPYGTNASMLATTSAAVLVPSRWPGWRRRCRNRSAATWGGQSQWIFTTVPDSSPIHSVGVPESDGIPATCQKDVMTAPSEDEAVDCRIPSLSRLSSRRTFESPMPFVSNSRSRISSLSKTGRPNNEARARASVVFPLPGNPDTTTNRLSKPSPRVAMLISSPSRHRRRPFSVSAE